MENTISILGCGWYGLKLAIKLQQNGFNVKGSTTSKEKLNLLQSSDIIPYQIEVTAESINCEPDFFDSQTLIICIPPKRSSGDQHDFPDKIRAIASAARNGKTTRVIFISSTSVYGDLNQIITESDKPEPITPSGKAMLEAEHILKSENSFITTVVRFAGLVGPGRDPARFFAGKQNIPNGQAPINLIHLEDCIGLTLAILEQEVFGCTLNAVNPDHPIKQNFYTAAAKKSGLAIPGFIDELNNWKIVATNHIPSILKYEFQISNWSNWLQRDKL